MHVLYMEDDEGLLYLLRNSLEAADFEVTSAANGERGLELLQKGHFDAVVIDQEMPIMTGLEFIQHIQTLKNIPPIIMVTGAGSEEVAVQAMRLGASDYLVKDTSLGYLKILPSVIHKVIRERELVQAHQAIEHALQLEKDRSQILRRFIQDASHEFRTPLTVIHSSCQLLGLISKEPKLQPYIQSIQVQADAILKLVDSLIHLARLDNTSVFNFVPVELNDTLRTLVMRKNMLITEKKLHIHLDLPEQARSIFADPNELLDSLTELLDNACRYSNVDGTLNISLRWDNTTAIITFQDTGIGMSDEQMSHIFERFYCVDKAHTTRGFGLGLPIAARIIELHHGAINVISELGIGTSVAISLPLVESLN